jgi:hypothetical protein
MKFTVTISDINEDEFPELCNRLNLNGMGVSVEKDFSDGNDVLNEMLEDISWSAFAVAHAIYQYGKEDLSLDFDQLKEILKITDRAISSRVGGTQRVATRLNIPSLLTIKDLQRTKIVRFEKQYIELMEEFLDKWEKEYIDWLEINELDQLKQDFIKWIKGG